MTKKIRSYIIFAVIALVIGYIIFDSTSQPNTNDLKGNFKEAAVYRNENNTGPVIRIYAVTVQGEPWEEMQKYGDLMPYTKYGSTKVYFFDEQKPFPKTLSPGDQSFDASFNANCLAMYTKDPNGQVSLNKKPF